MDEKEAVTWDMQNDGIFGAPLFILTVLFMLFRVVILNDGDFKFSMIRENNLVKNEKSIQIKKGRNK